MRLGRATGWRPAERGPADHSTAAPEGSTDETGWESTAIAVTGPPGAPGRSFVAINLAATLAEQSPTVLIDADPVLGTLSTQLDLDPERSLWFLAHEALLRPLDGELVSRHVQRSGGLDVLTGLDDPGETGACTPELVGAIVAELRATHRWLVVDAGALIGAFTAAVVGHCDGVLWTVTATEVGSVSFDRTLGGRAATGLTNDRWEGIVCNRWGRTSLPHAAADLEAAYGLPVLARIPLDPGPALRAETRHRPMVTAGGPRRGFTELARAVARAAAPDRPTTGAWQTPLMTPAAVTLATRT
ncbi:MAG TPA: hypothetical protein VNN74_07685 [Candidatus Micrarchaeia archaeon]|nr:hypothetical protein [Candidatus Micrarchaeia archaeon]